MYPKKRKVRVYWGELLTNSRQFHIGTHKNCGKSFLLKAWFLYLYKTEVLGLLKTPSQASNRFVFQHKNLLWIALALMLKAIV